MTAKNSGMPIIVPLAVTPFVIAVEDNIGYFRYMNGGSLVEGDVTDDRNPAFVGTGTPGELIKVYYDGILDGQTTVRADGNWDYTLRTSLAEGPHALSVTATDPVGDESTPWTINLTVDITPPPLINEATLNLHDNYGVTGSISRDTATDDNRPTLSGKADSEVKCVVVYDEAQELGTAMVDGNGDWSFMPPNDLVAGRHNFQVRSVDEAGNLSDATRPWEFTISGVPGPRAIAWLAGIADDEGVAGDFITNDQTLILNGRVDRSLLPGQNIQVSLDGGTIWQIAVYDRANGTWTYDNTAAPLAEGTHAIVVRVIDVFGVPGPERTQNITIDITPPAAIAAIISYADDAGSSRGDFGNATSTDDRTPTLHGILDTQILPGEVLHIYSGATLLGEANVTGTSWTFELPPLLNGSTHSLTAVVMDTAGNEGVVSNAFTITIGLGMSVESQTTDDTTPVVTGVLDAEIRSGEYVEVTIDNVTYSSRNGEVVVDANNGRWQVQIPNANALAEGTYEVVAELKDGGGNVIVADNSSNELIVKLSPSIVIIGGDGTNTAMTIGEDGSWRVLTNSVVFTQNGTDYSTLGSFSSIALSGVEKLQQSTFIDFNRDGRMDVFGQDDDPVNGQQSFRFNGTAYAGFQIGATTKDGGNANVTLGGTAGIDLDGDGLVDIMYGDVTPNDAAKYDKSCRDTQFIINDYTVSKGDNFTKWSCYYNNNDSKLGPKAQPDREISGVDLNNDGYVDVAYHATEGTNVTARGGSVANNPTRLVLATSGGDTCKGATLTCTQIVTNVFQGDSPSSAPFSNVAMTWADLNGDGYMDLFLGGLTGAIGANAASSTIYYNDGSGNLVAGDKTNKGVGAGDNVQSLSDGVNSFTSLAVDWNGDGRMDVIEIAGATTPTTDANNIGLLWINGGANQGRMVDWTQQTILSRANMDNDHVVTGALAIDLDYDGDQDMAVFRANGETSYVENTSQIQDGSSIILRILDYNGINSYYGNTVLLVDEATKKVVSSQIINAQSGVNTNDSTGLVYFYGLDANKSYSVVLLQSGQDSCGRFVAKDVGGISSVTMNSATKTVENVNAAWGGLKAVEADHAYVLTTPSKVLASTKDTNAVGVVGTGYDDTLFVTDGTHVYNGGGGSGDAAAGREWSNTGGLDIVDYKLAGSKTLTVDLSATGARSTGFGTQTLKNIEGVAGASGRDTFTDNAGDNSLEGRGGNDTFFLTKGGNDTLLYNLLVNADKTGGNGKDTVNGFTVGSWETDANADRIDVSKLLVGYQADADGPAHYVGGVATIDVGDTIGNYLSITYQGSNTVLCIDRDGSDRAFGAQEILTLVNTQVDLATLLANNQIMV